MAQRPNMFNVLDPDELKVEYEIRKINPTNPDAELQLTRYLAREFENPALKPTLPHSSISATQHEVGSCREASDRLSDICRDINIKTPVDNIRSTFIKCHHWWDRALRIKTYHGDLMGIGRTVAKLKRLTEFCSDLLEQNQTKFLNPPPPGVDVSFKNNLSVNSNSDKKNESNQTQASADVDNERNLASSSPNPNPIVTTAVSINDPSQPAVSKNHYAQIPDNYFYPPPPRVVSNQFISNVEQGKNIPPHSAPSTYAWMDNLNSNYSENVKTVQSVNAISSSNHKTGTPLISQTAYSIPQTLQNMQMPHSAPINRPVSNSRNLGQNSVFPTFPANMPSFENEIQRTSHINHLARVPPPTHNPNMPSLANSIPVPYLPNPHQVVSNPRYDTWGNQPLENLNQQSREAPVYSNPLQFPINYDTEFQYRSRAPKWNIKFDGLDFSQSTKRSLDVHDFIFRLQTFAQQDTIPLNRLPNILHNFVSETAEKWWWVYKRRSPNATWPEVRDALVSRFCNQESERSTRRALESRLQKGRESFSDFALEIESMNSRLSERYQFSEVELIEIMRENMNPALRNVTLNFRVISIEELRALCQRYEILWSQSGHDPRSINDGTGRKNIAELDVPFNTTPNYSYSKNIPEELQPTVSSSYEQNISFDSTLSAVSKGLSCWNCKANSHTFFDCPQEQMQVFCFGCGQANVRRPNCLRCNKSPENRQTNTLRSREVRSIPIITAPNPQKFQTVATNTEPPLHR